jgi:hypothetical protein
VKGEHLFILSVLSGNNNDQSGCITKSFVTMIMPCVVGMQVVLQDVCRYTKVCRA